MIWYTMLRYAFKIQKETPPYTEEFQTFLSRMKAKYTTNLQCKHLSFEIKHLKIELKLCCMLCYDMLGYDMTNEINEIVCCGLIF